MATKDFFYVEMTDTFGGDANYGWVKRFKVSANTMLGAVQKVSKESGMSWKNVGDYGDQRRYDSASSCTCFFIECFDESSHAEYSFTEI